MKLKIRETFSDWECGDGCCYSWETTFTINGVIDKEYFNSEYSYDNIENIFNALINKHCICGYDKDDKPLFCSASLFSIYTLEEIIERTENFQEDGEFDYPLKVLEFLGYKIRHEFRRI